MEMDRVSNFPGRVFAIRHGLTDHVGGHEREILPAVDYSLRVLAADNDGTKIEAFEWSPPPGAQGQGISLVFIPGGTGHARTQPTHGHAGAMGKLGARKRRVLAVSRRGTGQSSAPPANYSPADFAGDVRAAINAAGYQRFALFGHSMGVPIGLQLALRDPRGLVGLVLGDAPPEYIDFKAAGTFDKILEERFEFASWDEAFEAMTYRSGDRALDRAGFDSIRDRLFVQEPNGTVRYLLDRAALQRTVEESATAKTDYGPMLNRLEIPVLLLTSSSGWSPLSSDAVSVYERGIRDLTIQRLQTDHDLGQRTNPEALYGAIGGFLDRLDSVNAAAN